MLWIILISIAALLLISGLILGIVFLSIHMSKKKPANGSIYCVNCGEPIQQGAKYCSECGHTV